MKLNSSMRLKSQIGLHSRGIEMIIEM